MVRAARIRRQRFPPLMELRQMTVSALPIPTGTSPPGSLGSRFPAASPTRRLPFPRLRAGQALIRYFPLPGLFPEAPITQIWQTTMFGNPGGQFPARPMTTLSTSNMTRTIALETVSITGGGCTGPRTRLLKPEGKAKCSSTTRRAAVGGRCNLIPWAAEVPSTRFPYRAEKWCIRACSCTAAPPRPAPIRASPIVSSMTRCTCRIVVLRLEPARTRQLGRSTTLWMQLRERFPEAFPWTLTGPRMSLTSKFRLIHKLPERRRSFSTRTVWSSITFRDCPELRIA
jgi:hypothetical protein